jgi:hypothetical protein
MAPNYDAIRVWVRWEYAHPAYLSVPPSEHPDSVTTCDIHNGALRCHVRTRWQQHALAHKSRPILLPRAAYSIPIITLSLFRKQQVVA